jgi:hypothetical protein
MAATDTVTALPVQAPAPLEHPATEPLPASHPLWAWARRPFAADEIELLPKPLSKDYRNGTCDKEDRNGVRCGGWHAMPCIHLSYVGHAGLTMRFYEVDPFWSWSPTAWDVDPEQLKLAIQSGSTDMVDRIMANGTPRITGGVLWIRLHLLGCTYIGVGDAPGKSGGGAVKELIGDALRNAAMRAGIGTYLWSKSERAQGMVERGEGVDHAAEAAEQERGQRSQARRAARQENRRPADQGPAPAAPAPETDPGEQVAVNLAVLAAAERDSDKVRRTWTEAGPDGKAGPNGIRHILVSHHLNPGWLDVAVRAGLIKPRQPLNLGAWLGVCAKHVDTQGGLTIADAARQETRS